MQKASERRLIAKAKPGAASASGGMSGQSSENVSQNNLKSNTSQMSGNPYVKNQAKMQQKIEVKEPF